MFAIRDVLIPRLIVEVMRSIMAVVLLSHDTFGFINNQVHVRFLECLDLVI